MVNGMATKVDVTLNKTDNKYTVTISGGDEADKLLAKALVSLYILSAPVGMPAMKFSDFLTNKFKGNKYDTWKQKFPTFRKYAMYIENVIGKEKAKNLNITISVSNDTSPPKAISTHLILPINLEDVLISWLAAKVDKDALSQFELWVNDVVERAKLDAAANGVELVITVK